MVEIKGKRNEQPCSLPFTHYRNSNVGTRSGEVAAHAETEGMMKMEEVDVEVQIQV
jgi:hypothetical protein